jgi:DNA repair exonuclease SbcCD ATPase subunit
MSKTDDDFLNNLCNNISVDTSEFQNEYNDSVIDDIIHKMKELENEITNGKKHLTDMCADYQLRAYKTNVNIVKRNVIECNTQYNDLVVDYYKRVCYLKNNCIRNTDMVVSIYTDASNELEIVRKKFNEKCAEYNQLNAKYQDYNELKNEYSLLEYRFNEKCNECKLLATSCQELKSSENYYTQQSMKLRALEIELDTKRIRDEHEIKSYKHKINSLETKLETYMNHNKNYINKIDTLEDKIKSYKENEQYYIATYNESRKKIYDLETTLAELEKSSSKQTSMTDELREKLCCETASRMKTISDAQFLLRSKYTWNNETQQFEEYDFEVVE